MAKTFFFYDLETSGLNPREDRIMQFAGWRTDETLQPIGEPYNILVKLNDDTLPSPDAVMVTGITPQATQADGYTEAELARMLMEEIFTPDTVTIGFNSIRFDDEFIRHLFWRTFYDPYEWAWSEGRSRWDMLDVVRLTRALRPNGIEWPFDKDGKAVNKLELLAKINGLEHTKAHDALSDVEALIAVTRLIRERQPELFAYLFSMRDKRSISQLVNLEDKKPFVYASGRYAVEHHKTTVAFPLTAGRNGNVTVYDMRHDPTPFVGLSSNEIAARLFADREQRQRDDFVAIPIKELQYNRCPAVAPLGVLEKEDGWQKIALAPELVNKHLAILMAHPEFAENVRTANEGRPGFPSHSDPEAQLYDGFVGDQDRLRIEKVRTASLDQLSDLHPEFSDERLVGLLLHYKARSFARSLSDDERQLWEQWRHARVAAQLPGYAAALQRLAKTASDERQFLLEELQLWAENIVNNDDYESDE